MRCCFDFTGPRWLQNMKWKEVERYLKKGGATVILPCGQTEQHGPHLPGAVRLRCHPDWPAHRPEAAPDAPGEAYGPGTQGG